MSTADSPIMATPFESLACLALLRDALAADDLSACLPTPPPLTGRPYLPWEELSERTLHMRRDVHILLTFLAYGDRRRAQKKRANGWMPALRRPPALEELPLHTVRETLHAYPQRVHHLLLADDLDLLVRLAAQTRLARRKQRPNAAQWQAAFEQQLRRTWSLLENMTPHWGREVYPGREQEAWQACWRRLFGTEPPARLLPNEPAVPPRPGLPPSIIEQLGLDRV